MTTIDLSATEKQILDREYRDIGRLSYYTEENAITFTTLGTSEGKTDPDRIRGKKVDVHINGPTNVLHPVKEFQVDTNHTQDIMSHVERFEVGYTPSKHLRFRFSRTHKKCTPNMYFKKMSSASTGGHVIAVLTYERLRFPSHLSNDK